MALALRATPAALSKSAFLPICRTHGVLIEPPLSTNSKRKALLDE